MRGAVQVLLIAISISLAGLIFLISHEEKWLCWKIMIDLKRFVLEISPILGSLFSYVTYAIILLLLVLISFLSLIFIRKFLDETLLEKSTIKSIEHANDFYLPVYLGYAFIAVSLPTLTALLLFFILMLIILSRTSIFYFNPIFLILGYKFYFVTHTDGSKILVITKNNLMIMDDLFCSLDGSEISSLEMIEINRLTFLL